MQLLCYQQRVTLVIFHAADFSYCLILIIDCLLFLSTTHMTTLQPRSPWFAVVLQQSPRKTCGDFLTAVYRAESFRTVMKCVLYV